METLCLREIGPNRNVLSQKHLFYVTLTRYTSKQGYPPVKISNLVFSSDISGREVQTVVQRYTHNY